MCKICRLFFVAAGFFLLTTHAIAQPPDPLILTLDKAIGMAMAQNAAIQTSRIDVQIAQKQIMETTAIGLPQVSAALGYQYYLDVPTSLVPAEFFGGSPGEFAEIQFGTEQNLFASVSVNQIIFSGEYIVGLRAARIYRDLASHGLKRTELEVRTMTTETYLLSLLAKQNLQIVRENLINMQQTLFETEKILEAGFTDPINADQLKLTVANMKNSVSGLERQYQVTLNLLKFQIGTDITQGVELADDFDILMNNMSLEALSLQEFNPENHIDYKLMASQEAFSSMVLKREQSFYLPNLTASFVHQEMAMRNSFNFLKEGFPWFPTSYLSVNLNIPIFSSGMRSARVQQARLDLDKARIETWQVNQKIRMQMEQARAEFDTALEQYRNQQENLDLAERILTRTRIMHKEGMATSLELTQSSDQLLSTQAGYLSAMFDLLNAKNNYEKAMGR